MKNKTYLATAVIIFSIFGLAHLLRLIEVWKITINGYTIPLWVSWAAVLVAAFMVFHAQKLQK